MKHVTLLSALIVLPCCPAWAQAPIPKVSPVENAAVVADSKPAKEQIESAIKEYGQEYKAFRKKASKEKNRKKRKKLYKNEKPNPAGTIDLVFEIAKKDPLAEGVENGLLWGIQQADKAQRTRIIDLLLTHYKDSPELEALVENLVRHKDDPTVELRKIIKLAGDEKVRQGASYSLAKRMMSRPETKAEGIAMMKQLGASPGINANPNLHAQLKRDLVIAEQLSIGCVAPDIVGTDQNDKEFKLSDYRGQVVLLDFWGIW